LKIEQTFTIAEISKKTGLSQDTFRYYEKINILPSPKRSRNGQREYVRLDLDRALFVTHLKRTHMPLKKIQEYMKNSFEKNDDQCYNMLDEHKNKIEAQITEMLATLDILNYKLNHFQEIKTGKRVKP
jgi:DNA-binding transcriptional MerR regulator